MKKEIPAAVSLMPPSRVGILSLQDFASPLGYLQALAKEPEKE